jgi:nicotinate-nucleotide--dimethylbenzimidazole phosphoribosyltransferase
MGPVHLPPVPSPDAEARRAAVARYAELAVPAGALGRLAELGCWLAAAQGTCPPRPPARPRVVLVAADHGVAAVGVSAYPSAVTARQVVTAREHTSPAAVLALSAGASVRVVDVAVDHSPDAPPPGSLLAPDPRYRVGSGSGRIDRADALTEAETARAVEVGRTLADEEVDAGADLLVPGALGVGATTPASVLVAAVTGAEPVAVVGRGSGIDDETWMRKAAAVRDGLRRARPYVRDPLALLRVAGGADLAVLAGLLLQAALRRTPVLLDGLVVGAAALVADELAPGAREWWLLAQRSPEPAMALAAGHLELPPLLDLSIRTEDGAGALAALPLVGMAARLLAETATAADSGIVTVAAAESAAVPGAAVPGAAVSGAAVSGAGVPGADAGV